MPAYQNAKTKKWYCKFYYTDYEGNSRQKKKEGFTRKKDAQEWEREFLQSNSFSPSMSFDSFYEVFRKDTEPRLRAHTIQNRMYMYKNRLQPYFGEMPINEITPANIIRWQNDLINRGFARTYLSTCHVSLSTVFNHAVKFYGLSENPCRIAGSIGSDRPETEMKIWTHDNYQAAMQHIDNIKSKTAISLLFWSGIRKGELLALTWEDLNFDTGALNINKSLQRIKGVEIVTEPKTPKSIRNFRLPQQCIGDLKEYRQQIYGPQASDKIFDWQKQFIERGILKAHKETGIDRIRVHDLRHSHASMLIELGFSPLLIAQRLGHEKVETTLNTYAHLWPGKETELIDKLEEFDQKDPEKS